MTREFIIPRSGVKKKIIYHAGDFHLACRDGLSTEEEITRAVRETAFWKEERRSFALSAGEEFGEEQDKPAEAHFRRALDLASADGDALILSGDVFDYVSPANLRFYESAAEGLAIPVTAVCGNHEDKSAIPEGLAASRMRDEVQVLRLGDLTVVGIDDSRRQVSPAALGELRRLIRSESAILLAMHVPVMTDGNITLAEERGEYFFLNYDGCPGENLELIGLIRENAGKFAAVLTGHLHAPDESEIAPGVVQYAVSQGIAGNVNRYVIGE